jgi:alpha,alpha-trehalase
LQIMYGIGGERELTERTLDHLSGWRGARPVRVGNAAWNQRQHDVWGMILDAVDVQFRRNASQIEMQWQAGAEEIRAEVLEKGVSERGVFRQHYETDDLDASLLLLLLMGFLPPSDERMRATVLAIADELTKDDLVLRYRAEGTDTGFSGEEGTFTICSFWLVSALALIGQTDRARALCQKPLSFAGPLLLYAEEIDTTTGEHLGNFPQAFTHLALIEAVSLLIASEQKHGSESAR